MLPFFKNKGLINITETSLSKVVKTEHKKAYFFPLASASCSGKKWQTTAFSYSGHIKSSPPPHRKTLGKITSSGGWPSQCRYIPNSETRNLAAKADPE